MVINACMYVFWTCGACIYSNFHMQALYHSHKPSYVTTPSLRLHTLTLSFSPPPPNFTFCQVYMYLSSYFTLLNILLILTWTGSLNPFFSKIFLSHLPHTLKPFLPPLPSPPSPPPLHLHMSPFWWHHWNIAQSVPNSHESCHSPVKGTASTTWDPATTANEYKINSTSHHHHIKTHQQWFDIVMKLCVDCCMQLLIIKGWWAKSQQGESNGRDGPPHCPKADENHLIEVDQEHHQ